MKRAILAFFIIVMGALAISLGAQDVQDSRLTLEKALALAYAQSSEFRNAEIALEKAKLQWLASQPLMQSSVQLGAQYTIAEGGNSQTARSPFELSIGAAIPLLPQLSFSSSYALDGKLALGLSYAPFKSTTDLRQLVLQLEKTELAFDSVKQSITQTTVSYFNLAENAAYAQKYSALQEKLAAENHAAAEIEFDKGFISYYELSAAQSSYFAAQQNSIKAQNDYMTALFNLSVYLRSEVPDIQTDDAIPNEANTVALSEEELKKLMPFDTYLKAQKDYGELLLEYKAKQDTLQPAYPDLTLQCTGQYDTATSAVGLTLGGSIKLGTGTITQTSFDLQKMDLSQTESALADLYSKYRNSYAVLLRQIQQYTIACSSSYMQYAKAFQNRGNVEALFKQGMANSRELLQAEITLANSLVQYYQFYGNLRDRMTVLGIYAGEDEVARNP